jgi:putative transposase
MGNYHQLHYHVIWATKGRNSFIDNDLKATLWNYLKGKILEMGGVAFAVGGISDHVHLCLTIPPSISV